MDELDDGRGGDDGRIVRRRPELGGEHGEQGAEPLAAGFRQVQRRLGEEVLAVGEFADEELLHPLQPVANRGSELLVTEFDSGDSGAR